ncbi:MAG: transcription termination/antitermination NusG family protein, partial [Hydrogenoanaerobacterium sp.]
LLRKNVEAIVPTENRVVRAKSKWTEREYILLPGYVFVNIVLCDDIYHTLLNTDGVIRLLGTGATPSPLSEDEAAWIKYLNSELLEPSTIEFMGGGVYRIADGVLKNMINKIEHIDKHHRRVSVNLSIAGTPHHIKLSYKIYHEDNFKAVLHSF